MVATQKFSMIPSFPIQKFLGLDVMLPQPIGADKHLWLLQDHLTFGTNTDFTH